jgi:prepilin-type N-terminal cleavage/methylation domain-containing protein
MRSRSGHTLTELIVVMSITGVVATGAAVEVVRQRPAADLDRAAWEVTLQLRRARLQAIAQNVTCEVNLDTSDKTCEIWTDANADDVIDETEYHMVDLSDVNDLYIWTWPDEYFSFDSRGNFHANANGYEHQFVYLYSPHGGSKRLYIYGNGQVDLRDR